MFAVNYVVKGDNYNFVQAFSAKSRNSMWIAKDSRAWNLVFMKNEPLIAETSVMSFGMLYLRDANQGDIRRQLKALNCGGGWFAIANPDKNTVLVADTNRFIGLNADYLAFIYQWDLDTGQCKEVLQYYGGFDIFDLNSNGNLLAYGGEGKDNAVVIWNIEKQTEVCRTSEADYGHFVPNQNILALIRGSKMVFLDASSCQELRELSISTHGNYLAFSPDGQQFAVAEDSIELRNVSTGEILAQIPYPKNVVLLDHKLFSGGLEFSPDGHFLLIAFQATNPYSGKIQLWQVQ
jgi:WD40 repeat protein